MNVAQTDVRNDLQYVNTTAMERVINVWNHMPHSTDFRSLALFIRSVCFMDLPRYTCIHNSAYIIFACYVLCV